jgi:hypothetical protein
MLNFTVKHYKVYTKFNNSHNKIKQINSTEQSAS